MGFLDQLKGAAQSAISGEQHGAIANAAVQVLGNQSGGLAGLVGSLTKGGLGDTVKTWVGTGPNQPVAPDRLQQVIGSDMVAQIAAKAGISPEAAKVGLATVLPILIDKATPKGQLPADGGNLAAGLSGLLSAFGSKSV